MQPQTWMTSQGLTIATLSDKIGCSVTALWNLLNGHLNVQSRMIAKIEEMSRGKVSAVDFLSIYKEKELQIRLEKNSKPKLPQDKEQSQQIESNND
jgi:transcriptional regulator with XRE-family HTH domain